jgi:hypothetical protein
MSEADQFRQYAEEALIWVARSGALRLRVGGPEIKLAIVKQAEFKLATDLGGIGPIQREQSSTVPMSPPPMFGQRDHILCCIGQSSQNSAVLERQRSSQCLVEVRAIEHVRRRSAPVAIIRRYERARAIAQPGTGSDFGRHEE